MLVLCKVAIVCLISNLNRHSLALRLPDVLVPMETDPCQLHVPQMSPPQRERDLTDMTYGGGDYPANLVSCRRNFLP